MPIHFTLTMARNFLPLAAPVAGFSIDARVLSREEYAVGREADLSPLDLALGWGPMRRDDVLSQLKISQGARFYTYRWGRHWSVSARRTSHRRAPTCI